MTAKTPCIFGDQIFGITIRGITGNHNLNRESMQIRAIKTSVLPYLDVITNRGKRIEFS